MTIRTVAEQDWFRVGELSELLVRMHYELDNSRFVHPDTLRSHDYVARVRDEIGRGVAMVHVADDDGRVIGYVFAGIEPESWKELRHEAGYIHDVVVDPAFRGIGTGRALIASALDWLSARGIATSYPRSFHSVIPPIIERTRA